MIEGHDEDELEWILIVEKDVSPRPHLHTVADVLTTSCLATMHRRSSRRSARPSSVRRMG